MTANTANTANSKHDIPFMLVVGVFIALVGLIYILAFHAIPSTSHDIVLALCASLSNGLTMMIGYYFGSSVGSAKKTDALLKPEPGTTSTTSTTATNSTTINETKEPS